MLRGRELLEHLLGVGHLRNGGRRDEAHRVDVRETRADQLAQVLGLLLRWNLLVQPLPRVARALNDFDYVRHMCHR